MYILLLFIIIAVGIWWGVNWRLDASLERLKETGFQVDHVLASMPRVVLDDRDRKVAFLNLNQILIYDYEQVLGWEWGASQRPGWNDKGESDMIRQLTFRLNDNNNPTLRVDVLNEADANEWTILLKRSFPRHGNLLPR